MNKIFVFGSNLAGRHGAGAALHALKHHGAVYGQGEGLQGDSYALPTKDARIRTRNLEQIKESVQTFISHARRNPMQIFQVTCIGCGLAGLAHEDIAPMFAHAPGNCEFDTLWQPWLGEHCKYWGTY